MICFLCKQAFTADQLIEYPHPIYKSRGGTQTAPAHKACHRKHHSEQGDFKAWGKPGGTFSSLTWVWPVKRLINMPDQVYSGLKETIFQT